MKTVTYEILEYEGFEVGDYVQIDKITGWCDEVIDNNPFPDCSTPYIGEIKGMKKCLQSEYNHEWISAGIGEYGFVISELIAGDYISIISKVNKEKENTTPLPESLSNTKLFKFINYG